MRATRARKAAADMGFSKRSKSHNTESSIGSLRASLARSEAGVILISMVLSFTKLS